MLYIKQKKISNQEKGKHQMCQKVRVQKDLDIGKRKKNNRRIIFLLNDKS